MKIEKRTKSKDLKAIIEELSNQTIEELKNPQPNRKVENSAIFAQVLKRACEKKIPISIFGDYDCDGVTSSAILYKIIKSAGVIPTVRLPKRFSEGYGVSVKAIDELPVGLLILVDNGISANEAVDYAVSKGFYVMILDHHLPSGEIPKSKVIVNPHVNPANNGFVDYCAAGLAYKIAQLFVEDKKLLQECQMLASVGTVADVMPLICDNRYILKRGLKTLNEYRTVYNNGLTALKKELEIFSVNEQDIGFKIGPCLNAPGRLYDDGAMKSYKLLIEEDYKKAQILAKEIVEINKIRKEISQENIFLAKKYIKDNGLENSVPLNIVLSDNEGLSGIVAGKIAEEYQVPTFVFVEKDGVLVGSGRTSGNANLKEKLDSISETLLRFGGHEGAAGLSVEKSKFTEYCNAIGKAFEDYEKKEITVFYDLDIKDSEIPSIYKELCEYAPFGQGIPKPIFKVDNILLSPRNGKYYKTMGSDGSHLKLTGNGFSILAFGRADEFRKMGYPQRVSVIGSLSESKYMRMSEVQVECLNLGDVKAKESVKTGLLSALEANGTI